MVSAHAKRLNAKQREEASDARLLLESAAYNAAIVVNAKGDLAEAELQALANAAAQATQATNTLKRLVRDVKATP